jgi:hypothetical protein
MGEKTEEKDLDGWKKMFAAKEPRLSEAVELYKSLGFDVRLEPIRPENVDSDCTECFEKDSEGYKMIYTSKRRNPTDNIYDELYSQ